MSEKCRSALSLFRTPLCAPWTIFWAETGALTSPSTNVPLPSPLFCLKSPVAPRCLQDQVPASWHGTSGIFAASPKLTFSSHPCLHGPQLWAAKYVLSHHVCSSSCFYLGCPSPLLTLPTQSFLLPLYGPATSPASQACPGSHSRRWLPELCVSFHADLITTHAQL